MFRLTLALAAVVAAALAVATGALAHGVSGPAIYVNGVLYRTVGTPTDLSNTGAPDSTFQTIYDFSGGQMPPLYQGHNVADAAPGDPGFHGGRWRVHALSFANYGAALAAYDTNGSGDFDSAAEVEAALTGGVGGAEDLGVVKSFECPLIPVPGGGN
ncbi:MAG TPA: hypothetical protein VNH40_12330 [Gaiellaceae bacterium]|nr:hypothetical protein [Gaiellaceae bacterium]